MSSGAAALALVAVVLTACGSDGRRDDSRPRPERQRVEVGRGAGAAVVLRPPGRATRPAVVFLHGWGAVDPGAYGSWLRHLLRRGSPVVYPRYQRAALTAPGGVLPAAVRGVRLGLAELAARRYVAAGHSAGGALAADLAAVAAGARLPVPRAVFAAYPGRSIRGLPLGIPAADLAQVPAGVRIVALAGARDAIVGSAAARAIVRGATRVPPQRRRFRLISDPRVDGHLAPQDDGAAARRTFWRPLDRLVDGAR